MAANVTFRSYRPMDIEACCALFDANCPEFFAPNERTDYQGFLEANPIEYELCFSNGQVVGALGLMGDDARYRKLKWIIIDPSAQRLGVGSAMMERVVLHANELGVRVVSIAASHKSAPFFAKFGASEVTVTANGWGPGMHRVDMELRL